MTKLACFVTSIIVLVSLSACKHNCPVTKLNYEQKLQDVLAVAAKDTTETHINLCDLFSETSWDEFMILKPYVKQESLKALDLTNLVAVESDLDVIQHTDFNYALLFVANKTIISYSIVGHKPSFGQLGTEDIYIVTEANCAVDLERITYKGDTLFQIRE